MSTTRTRNTRNPLVEVRTRRGPSVRYLSPQKAEHLAIKDQSLAHVAGEVASTGIERERPKVRR